MRWRSGATQPQNEAIDGSVSPVSPIHSDEAAADEPDSSSGVTSSAAKSYSDPTHGRLGGNTPATSGLPPADTVETSTGNPETDEKKEERTAISDAAADDDPGLDHADEDGSSPTWEPQNQQSTCEFTHTITNYSEKRESGCKKAEYSATTVDECGNRWRLIVYVNGNGRASNHHLSLFLQVADANELPFGWKKAVSYVLTLEHPTGGNLGYAKRNPDKTFKLCPKAIDWGWSQFITSDRIQQEGYVSDDSLTVRASVTVKSSSVRIDSEDAELYLKCAVEEGKADAVKACLSQGAGVNCQFKDDLYTPLHTACSSSASTGSLEVLNLLLEKGADGNACNKWRETPLLIAANNGHKAAVEALLKHGADPSLCSEAGWSALTFAAHKGYDDIVALLLKAGAPVNCRVTEDLSTPLHKACAGSKPGHLSAVKQLLDNDADVHALNKWRETPLLTAANHGQASAVDALLKAGADPCKCTDTGWSPLSIAAYKGHDDVVRLLLEEGAPTEEADPTLSALLQAATKGLPDTVELLLRHGADHTVTTKKGDTALSILVEQNLIDAAVEMVTEYKASVPRCSRDRKKVQRARLLINLRVKQQQREGLLNLSTDEDETDDDSEDMNTALHVESPEAAAPSAGKKKKKKKKKPTSRESAEAQAKAAEEALLLELEQEESKAQKHEAAANSKRAKKKKKKERERQQKLKEEREQREREQREAEEKERARKIKEEADRKQREARLQEQRQREMQEAEERERQARDAAAKRKEREEKERRQREIERKERERKAATESVQSPSRNKTGAKAKPKIGPKNGQHGHFAPKPAAVATSPHAAKANMQMNKRGWETQKTVTPPNLAPSKSVPINVDRSAKQGRPPEPKHGDPRNGLRPAPLEHSTSDGVKGWGAVTSSPRVFPDISKQHVVPQSTDVSQFTGPSLVNGLTTNRQPPVEYELPEVALFRQEKLVQLFQHCAMARSQPRSEPLGVVSEDILKSVVYRWIVRAAHDTSAFLDPMIPSWTEFDRLTTFLQRQFIAESRKGITGSHAAGLVSMEAMKEAGTAFARVCQTLAKEIAQFRHQREEQLPRDWSDSTLNLTGSEVMRNGLGSMVCVDWAGRAQVYMPTLLFAKITERHTGSSTRLLTALFAAKKRYEIKGMLVAGTPMDYRLSPASKACLARDASVSFELWTDPFTSIANSAFFGQFADVDSCFGGHGAFGRGDITSDMQALIRGASVVVVSPLDNMVASLYIRRMVDLLETAEKEHIPLSFIVMLQAECFREQNRSPSAKDLVALEPRLGERQGSFVRCAEVLPPGQHCFHAGDGEGTANVCRTGSLFVLLQNEAGKHRYSFGEGALVNVIRSMSVNVMNETQFGPAIAYPETFMEPAMLAPGPVALPEPIGKSPRHQKAANQASFDLIGGQTIGRGFAEVPRPARRGRLFDLIDDGEDDNAADVDVVSGMLTSLDANIFKSSTTQDVDIEAISLMGIGGAPLGDNLSGGGRTAGRFG